MDFCYFILHAENNTLREKMIFYQAMGGIKSKNMSASNLYDLAIFRHVYLRYTDQSVLKIKKCILFKDFGNETEQMKVIIKIRISVVTFKT